MLDVKQIEELATKHGVRGDVEAFVRAVEHHTVTSAISILALSFPNPNLMISDAAHVVSHMDRLRWSVPMRNAE